MRDDIVHGIYAIAVLVLIVSSMYGLIVIAQYIGFASYTGEAGRITELVLEFTESQAYYGGVAGVAVRVQGFSSTQSVNVLADDIEKENFLFNCLNPDGEQEIYATTVPFASLDLTSVTAATPEEVDTYFGINASSIVSATNTYTQTFSITFGVSIISAPGTTTLGANLQPSNYTTILLKDNVGNLIFGSILDSNFTDCFDTSSCNYQYILPVWNQSNQTYYVWADPSDDCPAGDVGGRQFGYLIGNVTDDTGNQLEDVIIDVAGYVALTDSVGFYNLTTVEGDYNIFAIKEGYQTYKSNVSIIGANTTIHNIVMIAETTPNPNTGIGPGTDPPGTETQTGVGPGQDVGPGQAPAVPIIEQPKKIEGQDYVISLQDIDRKIRVGSFVQEILRFFSFKRTTAQVFLEINGSVSDLIEIDKDTIMVEPDGSEVVTMTIFGRGEPGIYNGTLIISGDMNGTIPIELELLPKEKLPVEAMIMQLETSDKSYVPGDNVKLKLDMRNMLTDNAYPVTLFLSVQNEEGEETFWTYNTNIFLRTSFSLIKSFKIPKSTTPDDYILRASATYLGLSSGTSTIFQVNLFWWKRSVFGLFPIWALLVGLTTLGLLIFGFFFIRKKIEEKKRYHLKVDYDTLPKPGPRSIFVGKIAETDHKTYFNMENFKTHTIVAGSTGGGKSVSGQVIIEEMLRRDVAVIVFDPTAQWTGMLRKCKDKTMLALYSYFGMKPNEAQPFNGNIREITDAREIIDVMKYVKPGEIQVFACHKLDPKDMDIVVANAIRQFFRSNPQESKPLKLMVVFDEVHRLLPKFGGSGQGFLQIERACREFRKWGIGVMLISQVLSDFVGTIKANINTEIQMRTRDEGDLERIRQKYGEDVLRSLVMATVGSGMVENPAYNNGKPFFVAFRPMLHSTERLSDEEIGNYHQFNERIDELEYSLQQLEEKGTDVFDLKLELKLALDKVKTGNFNIVQVYLDGITPRIDKEWEKLGEKPKKLEKNLVKLEELEAEFKSAQSEREEYEEEQKAKAAAEKKDAPEEDKLPPWNLDVDPAKMLKLVNGMIVLNQQSLYDEVSAMKDDDFEQHVNEQKNDVADWIENAIGDAELAGYLRVRPTKDQILELLDARKSRQELPELSEEEKSQLPTIAPVEKAAETSEEPVAETEVSTEDVIEEFAKEPAPAETVAEETVVAEEAPVEAETGEQPPEEETPAKPEPTPEPAPEPEPAPATMEESPEPAPEEENQNLESLVTDEPSKFFKLENGWEIKSVGELKEYLHEMPDDIFQNHVGEDYNHFADWIQGVWDASNVAENIRGITDKNQMAEAL